MTDTVIETERLVLRRIEPADAPFILRLTNEPTFVRHIGDKGVRDLDSARAYIRDGPRASYRRFGFGLYLAERRTGGAAIGVCGLLKRDELDDPDLGYALLPEFWSRGYAVEAARATLAYARDVLDRSRVVAVTATANAESIKVLETLGMTLERLIRFDGEPAEKLLFAWDPKTSGG